jgi:hypothetical protein
VSYPRLPPLGGKVVANEPPRQTGVDQTLVLALNTVISHIASAPFAYSSSPGGPARHQFHLFVPTSRQAV